MSFQHFRLGELAMHQPLPPHLMQPQPGANGEVQFPGQSFTTNPNNGHIFSSSSGSKQPYGSGDSDDGYTLVFPNLAAFNEWRQKEEETQMVEFVKGDTHGSKAVPPRFKDHTKLVCARHSRSGRKKYVKKHPDRVRKVPSRKLEGVGCSASISFKTYFNTEEVRASYNSQHSHETGLANLPYTRRGRKAAVQQEKERPRKHPRKEESASSPPINSSPSASMPPPPPPPNQFNSTVSMIAPLPGQPPYPQVPQPYGYVPQPYPMPPGPATAVSQDRWQNMSTLFNSIREHARNFEYPFASVVALESVLIRLFLESPVAMSQPGMIPVPGPLPPQLQQQAPPPGIDNNQSSGPSANTVQGTESEESGGEDDSS
ncbi:hypothetical protein EV421DRAFT_18575 [Armillaria borealis]|uniref:Uncharacterized protein n=1 Tax=Armillaria borealis TaxID=47425 RepID=A0AA39N3C4_9AGAR|nr:hypothetical protein EV421DRAFT_18575 [Armillaria borealis]